MIGPTSIELHAIADAHERDGAALSFDAALSALPAGWSWRRLTINSVSVYRRDPSLGPSARFDGHNANPASAFMAAIYRAKADSAAIAESVALSKVKA